MKQEQKKEKEIRARKEPAEAAVLTRGRTFRGFVKKKFHKRIVVEFERPVYIRKYDRYMKEKTRLHARLPDEMADKISIGDFVEVRECRPLSKIIHFMFVKKIKEAEEKITKREEEKEK